MISLSLLKLDGSAGFGKSRLNLLSFVLGNALFDRLRSCLNEILCVLQTQTRDLTDCLDDVQLLCAEACKDNVELGLLLSCGSCCGYTELLLNRLQEIGKLQNGQRLNLFQNIGNLFGCHFNIPPESFLYWMFRTDGTGTDGYTP